MVAFFQFLGQPENVLFLTALLVFSGLCALVLFGAVDGGAVNGADGANIDGLVDGVNIPLVFFLMPVFGLFGLLGLFLNLMTPQLISLTPAVQGTLSAVLSGLISWPASRKIAKFIAGILDGGGGLGDPSGRTGKVISESLCSDLNLAPGRISVPGEQGGSFTLRTRMMVGYETAVNGEEIRVFGKSADEPNTWLCVPLSEWPAKSE